MKHINNNLYFIYIRTEAVTNIKFVVFFQREYQYITKYKNIIFRYLRTNICDLTSLSVSLSFFIRLEMQIFQISNKIPKYKTNISSVALGLLNLHTVNVFILAQPNYSAKTIIIVKRKDEFVQSPP